MKTSNDELLVYFNTVLNNLKYEDVEFYKALSHWKPYLFSSCVKISKVIGEEAVDVFGNILVQLVKLNNYYNIPFYRFNGKVYECDDRSGPVMKLISPRFNKRRESPVTANVENVELVKKASLDSLVYTKIGQCLSSILRDYRTKKNGFIIEGTKLYKEPEISFQDYFSDFDDSLCFEDVISSDDVRNYLYYINQEDNVNYLLLKDEIYDNLSWVARAVFTCLCDDSMLSDTNISRMLNFPFSYLRFAHREISLVTEKILDDCYDVSYIRFSKVKPVYLRSDLICV